MGRPLQRLFSTFPDGWPGRGLMLLRVGAAVTLIYTGIAGQGGVLGQLPHVPLRVAAVLSGLFLFFGLWTPIAGAVAAIVETWNGLSLPLPQLELRWLHILMAVIAAAVAMLGPGAWSVDAQLFGRKRFEPIRRNRRS